PEHRVAKVRAPVVSAIDIRHGCGDPAFSHDRMRFAKQRLAHDTHARAPPQRFNCRAQPRAAGADDQNVVLVGFVLFGHSNLKSVITPDDTRRTYKYAKP